MAVSLRNMLASVHPPADNLLVYEKEGDLVTDDERWTSADRIESLAAEQAKADPSGQPPPDEAPPVPEDVLAVPREGLEDRPGARKKVLIIGAGDRRASSPRTSSSVRGTIRSSSRRRAASAAASTRCASRSRPGSTPRRARCAYRARTT